MDLAGAEGDGLLDGRIALVLNLAGTGEVDRLERGNVDHGFAAMVIHAADLQPREQGVQRALDDQQIRLVQCLKNIGSINLLATDDRQNAIIQYIYS